MPQDQSKEGIILYTLILLVQDHPYVPEIWPDQDWVKHLKTSSAATLNDAKPVLYIKNNVLHYQNVHGALRGVPVKKEQSIFEVQAR
eukprot:1160877-Pelagomonas_calceolata.AAC.6